LARVLVERVDSRGDLLSLTVRARATEALCPECASASGRVHDRYQRRLVDCSSGGRRVELRLKVRRFLCARPACPVKTFAEQVEGLTTPYARFTMQAREALTRIGLALAGCAGSRLSTALGLPAARMTLLRLIRAIPEAVPETSPAVLGVDEFALKKGHVYGTVLIDMDNRRPVDLLPDREAASFAAWLTAHPGAVAICRDRSGSFAEGARLGAPRAIHVADRWHLFHNLAEAAERIVSAHAACLREPAPSRPDPDVISIPAEAEPPDAATLGPGRLRDRVHQRHAAVHELIDQGRGIKQIARDLGLAIGTVRRYARAEAPGDMLHDQWQHRVSPLDQHKEHLRRRLAEGATNAAALYREIKALGYRGTYNPVRHYIRGRRPDKPAAPAPPPSVRAVTGYLTRHPAGLDKDERKQRADILARCPELAALAEHVRSFAEMMADRAGHLLDAWITDAQESGLAPLAGFARGLITDYEAVRNGLTLPHSSGAVEGNVNRIKMLKRQMYGRANFDLLRIRVLKAR
jgi:transposase